MTIIVYKLTGKWMNVKYSRSFSCSKKLGFDKYDGKTSKVITESNRNKDEN